MRTREDWHTPADGIRAIGDTHLFFARAAALCPIFPRAVTTMMLTVQMRNVVVDSGSLLALFDRNDAQPARVRQALMRNQGLLS